VTPARTLAVVSNHERAMGVGARREGDAGEHAIDRSANGVSDGYVLGDGKMNVFRDADTLSEGVKLSRTSSEG
jgi:hypothetical protein